MTDQPFLEASYTRTCPLCNSTAYQAISRKMQHGLNLTTVICEQCSFVFTNPIPSESLYNSFYEKNYATYYGHIAGTPPSITLTEPTGIIARRLENLEKFKMLRGARLMELGPGKGQFLYWARQCGSSVLGIEPSREFYSVLLQQNLPALNTTLEAVDPDLNGNHDIIVMSHVLEHFYNPNSALLHIRKLLNLDGIILIVVPDILRPYRSLDRYFLRYVHPSNFSPTTLRAMLFKHGFEVLHTDYEGSRWYEPQSLLVIARRLDQVPIGWVAPSGDSENVVRTLKQYRRWWNTLGSSVWHGHRLWLRTRRFVRRGLRRVISEIRKVVN